MSEKYIRVRKKVLNGAVFIISGCISGVLLILAGIVSMGICTVSGLTDYLLRKIEGS